MKQVFSTMLTDSKSSDVEGVGALRYGENGEIYRWVQNDESATTLAVGDAACHVFTDGTSMLQNIKIPATANLSALAGVVVSTSIPPAYYGWIQVAGICPSVKMMVPTAAVRAAGGTFKPVDAVTYLDLDNAAGTAPIYKRMAQLLEAVATAAATTVAYKKMQVFCL